MDLSATTFWLFWLTFVSLHHNQFNTDGCLGAAILQPLHPANTEEQKLHKGVQSQDEAINSKADASDFTAATHLKRAKHVDASENFSLDFKANVAKMFANDAPQLSTTTAPVTSTTNRNSSLHTNERRHIVPEKLQYTKEIIIKQGRLMGIVRHFHPTTGLRDVDQYLGLPYAEAPVGSRRFMPPGTPLPWQGLKIARHLPPVCPQKLPDVTLHDGQSMSPGRQKYITRLMPYLKIESEDCLYLNIYAPREDKFEQAHAYPVIVYLHGESFDWNSGNPYEGSVLASYGEVIVVTLNYRLGVLGFMKPGITENTVANFGLLDQIAALHWIKENIASFGGDKDKVTLMGHSSGAACVNYLMVSPVASGLFHRSILMSGSAMSDWASSNHSLQLTMKIAHALDCPLVDDNEAMLTCLREKPYQDLLHISIPTLQFSTVLGPIVDGHVIPNQPYQVMGQQTEYFSRYDLLFGITESESYHTLGASTLDEGLHEGERDSLLRFYMQNRFDVRPDLAVAATLKKYNEMYNNPIKATNLEHRDVVLDILSDARVVGPLLQTGLFHAEVNRQSYMYVFGHNSAAGPHSTLPHSIAGEELAFVFGAPLAPSGPFHNSYSPQEKLLSEAVMAYWTNFAKTGNPKAPWKGTFINLHTLEWARYDLEWPQFNKRTQAYLNIGIPPSIGYKYRQTYMNFWNKELPDELNQIAVLQQQPFLQAQLPRGGTSANYPTRLGSEVITGHLSNFGSRDNGAEDPVRTLKMLLQEPYGQPVQAETAENMYNAPPTFGVAKQMEEEIFGHNTVPTSIVYSTNGRTEATLVSSGNLDNEEKVAKSEATIHLLIGLIAFFIILNVIIYSTFLLQKKKKATAMKRKLGGILSYDGTNDEDLKRSKQHDGDDSYVLDMVRKSNTYEPVKTDRSPINGFKITRQLSTSTVDTHTKVCEWMMAQKPSGIPTLSRLQSSPMSTKKSSSPAFSSLRGSGSGSFKHPHKVSVAIDATPEGRGESVLVQEPIEVTKLKADGRNIIICQEVEVADQELLTPQSSLDASRYSLMRQQSAATEACDADLRQNEMDEQLKIAHKHSRSDPVDMSYCSDEQITSFMSDGNTDINVTSCDDATATQSLTPEQQLSVIKMRNYPKVLPTTARATDSPPMTLDLSTTHYKRNSLPPNSFLPHFSVNGRQQPPIPPPRISTLGRRPSAGRRTSRNITTSPLMLAQDCTEEENEPEITQNTLIVGPIVPKHKEGNYSTLKRNARTLDTACDNSTASNSATGSSTNSDVAGSSSTHDKKPNMEHIESRPGESNTAPAHHTERVYTIEAAAPANLASPTLTATPVSDRDAAIIYAQPTKSAIKQNPQGGARSGIPRMLPQTSPATPTAPAPAPAAIQTPQPTTSRIPQLNRSLIAATNAVQQQSNKDKSDCNISPGQAATALVTQSSIDSSSSSSSSGCSSTGANGSQDSRDSLASMSSVTSSSSSSTGTVRTELQQK